MNRQIVYWQLVLSIAPVLWALISVVLNHGNNYLGNFSYQFIAFLVVLVSQWYLLLDFISTRAAHRFGKDWKTIIIKINLAIGIFFLGSFLFSMVTFWNKINLGFFSMVIFFGFILLGLLMYLGTSVVLFLRLEK